MKKFTSQLVLLALLNQLFFYEVLVGEENKQIYSVAYLGNPSQKESRAFKVLEKRIQIWMENGPFGKVQVNVIKGNVANNELLLEELKSQISEYTRTLKKAVLESPDKNKGSRSLVEIKALRKKMNLNGRFGPLLQKSYLAEAAYLWKNERFDESESALKSAIELGPLGKPTLEDWDMFASSFGLFAFEKEVSRVYQKVNQFCETNLNVKQKNVELMVNGFDIKEKRAVKLAAKSMHVITVRDDKGHSFESVFHCLKKSQKSITLDLTKGSVINNELSLRDALKSLGAEGLFLSTFNKDVLQLYFYSKKIGVTPISLERKVTLSELLEASQDFKMPLSYSSFNRILSNHSGANRMLLVGTRKSFAENDSLEEKFRNSKNKWYNNPVLWGVVGGLLVGATTTYVLTKEGESNEAAAYLSTE